MPWISNLPRVARPRGLGSLGSRLGAYGTWVVDKPWGLSPAVVAGQPAPYSRDVATLTYPMAPVSRLTALQTGGVVPGGTWPRVLPGVSPVIRSPMIEAGKQVQDMPGNWSGSGGLGYVPMGVAEFPRHMLERGFRGYGAPGVETHDIVIEGTTYKVDVDPARAQEILDKMAAVFKRSKADYEALDRILAGLLARAQRWWNTVPSFRMALDAQGLTPYDWFRRENAAALETKDLFHRLYEKMRRDASAVLAPLGLTADEIRVARRRAGFEGMDWGAVAAAAVAVVVAGALVLLGAPVWAALGIVVAGGLIYVGVASGNAIKEAITGKTEADRALAVKALNERLDRWQVTYGIPASEIAAAKGDIATAGKPGLDWATLVLVAGGAIVGVFALTRVFGAARQVRVQSPVVFRRPLTLEAPRRGPGRPRKHPVEEVLA